MIKTIIGAVGLSLCLAGTAVAETAKAPTAQQQRMKDCNGQATGKKGDERKAFMSACLSGKETPAAAKSSPQQRMKDCNQQATGKKGDERKAFMSACLKG